MRITTILLISLIQSLVITTFAAFTATDSILVSCGAAKDGVDTDGRRWAADGAHRAKYRLASGQSMVAQAEFQDPSLPSAVPYMTARLFTSESTYKFPISSNGSHWVRLHFYPASYNSLNPDDALFSVTLSGGFTVLHNFSASVTATALTQAYIIKEFVIPAVENGSMVVTFTPSDKHNGSYAFVNGIEVISMPDLFSQPATMVGVSSLPGLPPGGSSMYGKQTMTVGDAALQEMYRLNVGGQYIPASNDSELSRIWYDDTPYLYGASVGVTQTPKNSKTRIEYTTTTPDYMAPTEVYLTARSMGGNDPTVSQNYNLTWIFQVDANFTYLVRLHFCEFMLSKPNQRVFQIFVNNQTAETEADVISWTGGEDLPLYKDYTIYVSEKAGDEQLWVALHPAMAAKPEYLDAFLNGIEIYKLSDSAKNLAGPNPIPSALLVESESEQVGFESGSSGKKKQLVIGGVAGGALILTVAFLLCFTVRHRKRRMENGDSVAGWLPIYGSSHTSASKSNISGRSMNSSSHLAMAAGLCRHFSIDEVKKGTKNFDESLVIGVGGFGKVYKGVVDGNMKVAIKRSNPQSEQGVHEFQTEIEMLSKLRHKHLVSLIGFCEQNNEMCLVYDFMAHGTLREHLYKSNNPPLSWKQRLEICIGAARGLHYLHTGAQYTIIHRDVKTTNILVDENWVAKVSDFGLSKTGPMLNETHVSTVVKGSFGYLDPEYFRRQQLTDKSDVYSFGVVLFEVLCARPALNTNLSKEQVSLADWALHCQKKGVLEDIMDPLLKGQINTECFKKFAETAANCLSDHGMDRPSMGDVLWNLEFAQQLQEGSEGRCGDTMIDDDSVSSCRRLMTNHGSNSEVSEEANGGSDGMIVNEVFSQLIHPRGR